MIFFLNFYSSNRLSVQLSMFNLHAIYPEKLGSTDKDNILTS